MSLLVCFLLLYLAISCYGIRLCTSVNNNSFLDKTFTNQLRGCAILAIVISHSINVLYFMRELSPSLIKYFFGILAPIGVGIFLFLSGYGNTFSIKKKLSWRWLFEKSSRLYVATGILLFLQFIFAMFIFKIDSLFPEKYYSFLKNFIFLTQPPFTSWYLKVQFAAYITLFLFMKFSKKYYIWMLTSFWLLFVIYCIVYGKQGCWWVSTMCFPLGCLFAEKKDYIKEIFLQKAYLYSIIFAVLCIVLYLLIAPFGSFFIVSLCVICCISIAPFSFVIFLKSNILNFLGKYSLEIYLLHLACISILEKLSFVNVPFKIILTILITLLFAKPVNIVSNLVSKKMLKV